MQIVNHCASDVQYWTRCIFDHLGVPEMGRVARNCYGARTILDQCRNSVVEPRKRTLSASEESRWSVWNSRVTP